MQAIYQFLVDVPAWQTAVSSALLVLSVITNAFDQAHIWARGGAVDSALLSRVRVHAVDEVQELGYHLWAHLFANSVVILGVSLVLRPLFEGIINIGVGRSFFDEGAEADDFIVRVGSYELYRRPKLDGRWPRILQWVAGALLIVLGVWLT